jgi:MipA family protein
VATLAFAPFSAFGQPQVPTLDETPTQYSMDMGVGLQFKPKYPGADEYLIVPFPIFGVQRFFVPGLGQVVDGKKETRAFFIYPSFDFNGRRNPSDSSDLTGTEEIDWALEVGLAVGYRYDWLRGTVKMRQGFNGHHGQVVELGLDVVANPNDSFQFSIGPRLTWASEDYMDTYFGVSSAEAAAPGSVLKPYAPDSSFESAGIEALASYNLTERTRFHLRGGWQRYIGDAVKSPIVSVGDENNFSIGVGLSYRFSFDLF